MWLRFGVCVGVGWLFCVFWLFVRPRVHVRVNESRWYRPGGIHVTEYILRSTRRPTSMTEYIPRATCVLQQVTGFNYRRGFYAFPRKVAGLGHQWLPEEVPTGAAETAPSLVEQEDPASSSNRRSIFLRCRSLLCAMPRSSTPPGPSFLFGGLKPERRECLFS